MSRPPKSAMFTSNTGATPRPFRLFLDRGSPSEGSIGGMGIIPETKQNAPDMDHHHQPIPRDRSASRMRRTTGFWVRPRQPNLASPFLMASSQGDQALWVFQFGGNFDDPDDARSGEAAGMQSVATFRRTRSSRIQRRPR